MTDYKGKRKKIVQLSSYYVTECAFCIKEFYAIYYYRTIIGECGCMNYKCESLLSLIPKYFWWTFECAMF